MSHACSARSAMLALLGFFFTVDIHLSENGSGTLIANYPMPPIDSLDDERKRFASPVTDVLDVTSREDTVHGGRIARVEVAFTDIAQVSQARELLGVTFGLGDADRGRHLLGVIRSPGAPVEMRSDGEATIRLTVPGEIVASNTPKTRRSTATWRVPVTRYFAAEGIPIDVTFRSPAQTASMEHSATTP